MKTQIDEVLTFVEDERQKGRTTSEILSGIKVARSSYYRWRQSITHCQEKVSQKEERVTVRSVTEEELKKIDQIKEEHPEKRHRQLQGLLQLRGHYISSSVVYKRLKATGKVDTYARRAAPWKEPFYEVWRADVMWGADWTKLRIGGERWYLLTLIDFFSRVIVNYEIVRTVNAGHIKRLYQGGLSNSNIPLDWHLKPELRVDQGSPNTSGVTKSFFKDIKAELSFARVRRPTDNAITERFYRTIKQEEIYVVGDYQDEATAREVLGEYIKWYNEQRPHQSLWNFTPLMVHEMNNKTELLEMLSELKRKTWTKRKEFWMEQKIGLDGGRKNV
jgi:putative transposase